ncbi:hypothetical protein PAXINDRAFT_98114, partial [Paxillus involutus ATCC 200175]
MNVNHEDLMLHTPEQFPAFPYDPPYSIQNDLMKHVYSSIERKHVTIVESPTGTGKTLSLLCSSLSWLTDERERARKGQATQQASGSNVPTWVTAQAAQIQQRELEAQDREYEERLEKARKTEARLRALARARVTKRQRFSASTVRGPEGDDEDVFLPDGEAKDGDDNISPVVRALMEKWVPPGFNHGGCFLNFNGRVDKGIAKHPSSWSESQEPTCTKVYYASRTHSQLTQVLPELRKLNFRHISHGPSDPSPQPSRPESRITTPLFNHKKRSVEADDTEQNSDTGRRQWRTVALGSRKQLCINDDIRSKSGDLDEMCRGLLDAKEEKRCHYLPPAEDGLRMLDFRDQILAVPKDIEDLAAAGQNAQTCPYYGSRRAIPQAELITLPYNLLLQKTARDALGIDLSNQVVIID